MGEPGPDGDVGPIVSQFIFKITSFYSTVCHWFFSSPCHHLHCQSLPLFVSTSCMM